MSTPQRSIAIPAKEWIGQSAKYLRWDIIAGLTLWGMIVPEAIAYASLAGAPAQAGLYTIMICLPIYVIFASSRFLVPTPTSAVSATVGGFVAVMASDADVSVGALTLATALCYLLFAFLNFGFVTDFISQPVNRGFVFGLAVFIVVSQVPKVLGVDKGSGNAVERTVDVVKKIDTLNWTTVLVAGAAFAVLFGLPLLNSKLPAGLLAIGGAMVASRLLDIGDKYDVDMVGKLPDGLPSVLLPTVKLSDLTIIAPAAVGLVLLGMSEATAVADEMADEHGQEVDANQQMYAFGFANLAGGFFGTLISSGSMSSSSVNHESGAKTPMSIIVAAVAALLTSLFLTPIFAYLPEALLGALIIHAVWRNLAIRTVTRIRRFSTGEFYISALAAAGVLLLDVLPGLLMAMFINLIYYAFLNSRIQIEEMGTLASSPSTLVDFDYPGVQRPPPGVLAVGYRNGRIYYASVRRAKQQFANLLKQHPHVHTVVLDMARMDSMDFTTRAGISKLQGIAKQNDVTLYLTNVRNSQLAHDLEHMHLDPDYVNVSAALEPDDVAKLFAGESIDHQPEK